MTVPMRATERRESVHARREERRTELLRAAMDVIRQGGADATMEEMASAGGISKPILYRHFTDREGLVAAITEHALGVLGRILDQKLDEVRTGNWRDTVRATIDAFSSTSSESPSCTASSSTTTPGRAARRPTRSPSRCRNTSRPRSSTV